MKPGPSREVVQRIEGIEGRPVGEALRLRYVDERRSYRNICALWGINTRTLMRLLTHFGIKPRRGGEAVRTQWEGDSEARRKASAQTMSETSRRLARAGKHPRKGKTKETDEGARRAAEKLRVSTSARRPEVREKFSAAHRLLVRRNATGHPTSKMAPTKAEAIALEHVAGLGHEVIHNHVVQTSSGPRWINVFVPGLNLGIGCESYGRFPLSWERHRAVSELGIRAVYITNHRIYRRRFDGLDQYIALVDSVRPHPTAHGQNTVVWGRQNPAVFDIQPDKVAVESVSMDRGHTLFLTTAPDDPVLLAYRLDSDEA